MNARSLVPLSMLLCGLVVAGGIWWRLRARAPAPEQGLEPVPGAEVNLYWGRGALVLEGDGADPLQRVSVTQDGRELRVDFWAQGAQWRALAFLAGQAGPLEALVETTCRRVSRRVVPGPVAEGLLLKQIDLLGLENLPADAAPSVALAFSPDGRTLAIGSASGALKLLCLGENGLAYERRLGTGPLTELAYAEGSAALVAAAPPPAGFLCGLEASSGRELWRLALDEEVGGQGARKGCAGASRVLALPGGDVLALARGFEVPGAADTAGTPERFRLFRLDARTGAVRWRFPAGAPLSGAWPALASGGARLACWIRKGAPVGAAELAVPAELVFLDARTGAVTGALALPTPLAVPGASPSRTLALLPDGSGGIAATDDGRLCAFDLDADGRPALRWQDDLGVSVQVGAARVQAPVVWVAAAADGFYAALGRSVAPAEAGQANYSGKVVHPEACTLQVFGSRAETRRPERLWRYEISGTPQGQWLSPDGRWLACAYERRSGEEDAGAPEHGVGMLDLLKEGTGAQKLAYRLSTEGPLLPQACFSPDGRYLAVGEGPSSKPEGGGAARTYRVLILH